MQNPTCLYHRDGSVITIDASEVSDYLAQGYADTPDAFEGLEPEAPEVADEVPADDGPPTRAELEAAAKERNIPFNVRTTNETLAERIAAFEKG